MARHNREGHGADQRGFEYGVNYQPDWLKQVKVTRQLETGRQSTKTLFRNPERAAAEPGDRIRTRIVSQDQRLDFEVALTDPKAAVRRIRVADRADIVFLVRIVFLTDCFLCLLLLWEILLGFRSCRIFLCLGACFL